MVIDLPGLHSTLCALHPQLLLLQERSELIKAHGGEMEKLFEKRGQMEQAFLEHFLATAEDYQKQLEEMRSADAEDYNVLKVRSEQLCSSVSACQMLEGSQCSHGPAMQGHITMLATCNHSRHGYRQSQPMQSSAVSTLAACLSGLPSRDPAWQCRLETDIQNLEQHLEAMRATYQLNQEKLEYNFRVLTERDAENQATINQQKRKISRQRDVLSVMMVGVAGSMAGHVRTLCLLMVLLLPAAWQVVARMSAGS